MNNTQYGPYPVDLLDVVSNATYPPEVASATLQEIERDHAKSHGSAAGGLTLVLYIVSKDSYGKAERHVNHYFPVPCATFNRESWKRWLFDRVADMRMHELMEYFVVDGERPFQPLHGPGDNPYVVHQASSDLQRRTAYTGEIKE